MSGFDDIGRRAVEAMITAKLGLHAGDFEVPAAVEAFVAKWGFVDIDEVPADDFWRLLREHAKAVSE